MSKQCKKTENEYRFVIKPFYKMTLEEKKERANLIVDQYLAKGIITPNQKRREEFHYVVEDVFYITVMAYALNNFEKELVATASIYYKNHPIKKYKSKENVFEKVLEKLNIKSEAELIEIGRYASKKHDDYVLTLKTLAYIYMIIKENFPHKEIIVCSNDKHADIYEEIFGFKRLYEAQPPEELNEKPLIVSHYSIKKFGKVNILERIIKKWKLKALQTNNILSKKEKEINFIKSYG